MKLPYKYAFSGLLPILSAPASFKLIAKVVSFSGFEVAISLESAPQ
jgi:hypothetical protein